MRQVDSWIGVSGDETLKSEKIAQVCEEGRRDFSSDNEAFNSNIFLATNISRNQIKSDRIQSRSDSICVVLKAVVITLADDRSA